MIKQRGFSIVSIIVLFTSLVVVALLLLQMYRESNDYNTETPTSVIDNKQSIDDGKNTTEPNIFIDSNNTFSFEYDDYYTPVENIVIEDIKISGQGRLKASAVKNYNPDSYSSCEETNYAYPCLQKHWNFEDGRVKSYEGYVKEIALDGKTAKSFFLNTEALDGVTALHVVQVENPSVEIFMNVDGIEGEETFQKLLSTFKWGN
jgi:hypothetical protein